jgi:hypothetical protein
MNDAFAVKVLTERRAEHRKAVEILKMMKPTPNRDINLAWHRKQIHALNCAINRLAGKRRCAMSDTATQYPIPRGWRRVTRGYIRRGDRLRYLFNGKYRFGRVEVWKYGHPVKNYLCVIRRIKGGAK